MPLLLRTFPDNAARVKLEHKTLTPNYGTCSEVPHYKSHNDRKRFVWMLRKDSLPVSDNHCVPSRWSSVQNIWNTTCCVKNPAVRRARERCREILIASNWKLNWFSCPWINYVFTESWHLKIFCGVPRQDWVLRDLQIKNSFGCGNDTFHSFQLWYPNESHSWFVQ